MSKKTKRTIVIIAAAALLTAAAVIIFFVVKANSAGYRSISIAEIFGKVIAQNGGKTYEAYKNMRLADGYELSTDPDSYTRMLLDDDKYVKLEQESHAIFEALGDAKRHITTIRLDKGSLTTEITKPLTESESYVVNTPNAVLAVRGTLFRVEVKQEANGDYYCDVYTYGGSVGSHRIMPDGTHVDEEIVIPAGYKATIKMDEIITVYLEEKIDEEEEDNIDPLHISEVNDGDLVNVYNASAHGHKMFLPTEELWNEITGRDIDLSKFKSLYDGNIILPFEPEDLGDSVISDNSADEDSGAYSSAVISRDPPPSSSSGSSASSGSNDNNTHTPETSQRPVQSGSVSLPASSEPVPAESEPSATTSRVPRPESSSGTSSSSSSTSSSSSGSSRPTGSSSSSTNTETPEPAVHTHTPVTTTEPATCVTPGSVTVKCAECNELISSESINPLGHTTRTVTTPSTCTEPGKEEQICERCSALLGKKELPLADHTEAAETEGDITTRKCGVCGELISQTNNVTGVVYPVALDETNFPDPVFLEYVTRFDEDGDGVLSLEECDKVTEIDVSGTSSNDGGITSLKGVEIFINLQRLQCMYNSELTELDVSPNIALEYLWFMNTSVSSIDVSNNKMLTQLGCSNISSLDLSQNVKLQQLRCIYSSIKSLDLTNNTDLYELRCPNNQLAFIDVSGNTNLSKFGADGNEYPIHVEDGVFDLKSIDGFDISRIVDGTLTGATMDANGVLSGITEGVNITYTYDCKGTGESAYQAEFTLVPDESSTFAPEPEGVAINEENFPDEKFRTYVSSNFDTDGNGYLSQEECEAVTEIRVSGTASADGGITSLGGIENFSKLQTLSCYFNSGLTSLDVSNNTALEYLYCYNTQITSLDVSKNTALTDLRCNHTQITSLDVSNNTALTSLDCCNTQITSLDVSNNIALTELSCAFSKLYSTSLDLSKNTALIYLDCRYTNITTLDISKNTLLNALLCSGTQITSLDLSNNTALETLHCEYTKITSLDLSNQVLLTTLQCGGNQMAFVDISKCANINFFGAYGNVHPIIVTDDTIDLNNIEGFDFTRIVEGTLTGAVMDENGLLSGITEGTSISYTYDCKGTGESAYQAEFTLVPDESSTFAPAITYPVAINDTNFPDEVFRKYVSENFDTDGDGELSQEECEAVTGINVGGASAEEDSVTSLVGIEYFLNLDTLQCTSNSRLAELDVSKNTKLTELWCNETGITSLDLSKNPKLTVLICGSTPIDSLDISNNTALTDLDCYSTQIAALDVSNNTALEYLYCYNTQITSLDVSKNTALTYLWCSNTQIPFVDISNNTKLTSFYVYNNKYPISADTLQFDITSDMNFAGFNLARVSNVQGADFSPESGIFDNFTADEITYTYDCKGTGESKYMVTFTLVRTPEVTASLSDEDDNFTVLPPDDINPTPPPNAPEETGGAPNEDAALPPEDIDGLRFLPLGILALMRDRKRKTAFRVRRKAEI